MRVPEYLIRALKSTILKLIDFFQSKSQSNGKIVDLVLSPVDIFKLILRIDEPLIRDVKIILL